MTRQRPTPIEESMIPVKFRVVEVVSFTPQRVSQIMVSCEQCRIYQIIRRRVGYFSHQLTPPPRSFQQSSFEGEAQRQTRAGGELAVQPLRLLFVIGLPLESTRLG